jgi:hypothetical protein
VSINGEGVPDYLWDFLSTPDFTVLADIVVGLRIERQSTIVWLMQIDYNVDIPYFVLFSC